ncbi:MULTISPECIES: hypothetical protein [Candidatus Ichthyocystis]|uniref:Uncharacterized protein n=1 Tax=Candidatus Ichthyocystis hellenicum TaxID=1561003 RepID=A0A0S4M4Y8_9BURK|nr:MULTISPECIES: hypothetical protein [Ichthyocystis]CUT17954.1 hypothetical protein Ark11_1141 [Candidatus Ichthyocystis hellenicum]
MASVDSSPLNETHEVADRLTGCIEQVYTGNSTVGDTYKPCRSFNCASGINISSDITQIDPELVDSDSIADIVLSLENNNLSKYLSSIDSFTARFMSKSLRYVRALRFEPHYPVMHWPAMYTTPNEDGYIDYGRNIRSRYVDELVTGPSDYNADYGHDITGSNRLIYEPTDDIRKLYGRLQYMCDYFKYYILEGQFDCLLCNIDYDEKHSPLLDKVNEKINNDSPIGVEFEVEEVALPAQANTGYEKLVVSIRNECLELMKEKRKLIHDQVTNLKLLKIRYLDNSTRDMLIMYLMEYYLLITDKFESMAESNFKYRDEILSEKIILPIPREIAELIHEEIETGRPTSDYSDKEDDFFCDGHRCLCISSFKNKHTPGINREASIFSLKILRHSVIERVADRMKCYLLSLNEENII